MSLDKLNDTLSNMSMREWAKVRQQVLEKAGKPDDNTPFGLVLDEFTAEELHTLAHQLELMAVARAGAERIACSFCGKNSRETEDVIVSGPVLCCDQHGDEVRVYICAECVELCGEIVYERRTEGQD